nr:hypothetical protein [Tanacetum cinerariifolium]
MAQFWHTLKEDGLKYRLKFMLDKKEISLTPDDFRKIFHLSQENNNNHDRFVPPPSFFDMVPFYKNELRFTMELKTSSTFKTNGLLQPWETDTIGRNSLFSSSFNIFDSLSKIYKDHHCLDDLRSDEAHRALSDVCEVFGIDVPLTQSQPTESTQGTYMIPSAPRSPNPKLDATVSSAPKRSTVIHFRIPQRRSTRLTPPTPVPTVDKADEMILQDTLQVSLVEHKSIEEQEARENVELVNEHLASMEIEKMELQGCYRYLFEHLRARKSFATLDDHLQEVMVDSLPTMVEKHVKEQVQNQVPEQVRDPVPVYVAKGLILERQKNKEEIEKMIAKAILQEPLQMKFGILQVPQTTCRTSAVHPRDQDDPQDDAHPERENSAKRQKTFEYRAYVSGESSSGHDNEKEQGPSTLDIMEELSLTINEAKLKKIADEMLRQRCTSRDEHQYHNDQMKNFLKSDIVWESRKEILVSPHPRKTTTLVQSCQRDPEAPTLSMINQDLLYLKKGSSGPEKIVLSLHKFPAVIFNNDDIEERIFRWVNKCVKKFNPYARYGVEH